MQKSLFSIFFAVIMGISFAGNAFADNIYFFKTNKTNENSISEFKEIHLKNITLSPDERQQLLSRLDNLQKQRSYSRDNMVAPFVLATAPSLPVSVALGMNGVPVLDQGPYGTCATFATTAALDAIGAFPVDAKSGQKDYISQTCFLQVSRFDNNDPGIWSGGGDAYYIANSIQHNGVILDSYERDHGCGGLYNYPLIESSARLLGSAFPMSEYVRDSDKQFSGLIVKQLQGDNRPNTLLLKVKQILANQNRVVVSFFTSPVTVGNPGVYGYCQTFNNAIITDPSQSIIDRNPDSFVLTSEVMQKIRNSGVSGGHAMIATGYDDNGVILDSDGHEHRGVLMFRNSWGPDVGDHGDFYMSYEYFETLATEAIDLSL